MDLAGGIGVGLAGLSIVGLYYVYDGYGRILSLLVKRRPGAGGEVAVERAIELPSVTVIIPVYNEEMRIGGKLENTLAQEYPREKVEILVVSDGSSDGTDELVRRYEGVGVRLIRTDGRVGKSLAQNRAVREARGDILLLTDSAVEMTPGCIEALVSPFERHDVGLATAHLLFRRGGCSVLSEDQGYYWRYELKLRALESELGILATAAGPLCGIRRDLWRDLDAGFGDDCVLPLDVALQGRKVVHVSSAVGWDEYFGTARQEFRGRVRMTVRNWTGTFSRRDLLNPAKYPGYAFSLWSHKILRWLSPVFLVALGLGVTLIGVAGASWLPAAIYAVAVSVGGLGVGAVLRNRRIVGVSTLGSFLLANAGFGVGLLRVMQRRRIRLYDNK